MSAEPIEPKSWVRSAWFTWSWMVVLVLVVLQTFIYQCRVLPTTAAGYFSRGRTDYLEGAYEEAVKNFSTSIAKDAANEESWIWRGESYVKLHEFDKAKSDLLKALELAPAYAKSHAAFADYHAAVWDADGAIEEFTAAVDRDPKYGRSYLERGQLHFDAGRWDAAAADLRTATTVLDDDPEALAHLFLWLARVRSGDAAGATAELSETLKAMKVAAPWFPATVAFLRGEKTEPEYFTQVAGTRESEDAKVRLAEAYFLAGEKRLAEGDRAGALGLLREVIRSGSEESDAFDRARVELQRSFLGFAPMRRDDGSLVIVSVTPGGPAEAAGIVAGAKLTSIDDEPADRESFLELLAALNPGLKMSLAITAADGSERVVTLEIPLTLETSAPTK